jgi:hypothetical protein
MATILTQSRQVQDGRLLVRRRQWHGVVPNHPEQSCRAALLPDCWQAASQAKMATPPSPATDTSTPPAESAC